MDFKLNVNVSYLLEIIFVQEIKILHLAEFQLSDFSHSKLEEGRRKGLKIEL
jgi:hypothetical protein